ncbi:MAG: alpha/beta fold hydrolase [Sphingomonadaceae bacterium]
MSGQVRSRSFASFDGAELVWHEMGEGRPAVLLHGLFSSADMNWIRFGHAGTIAGAGFRVIMPDLRAHGKSAAPHDPVAYPPDVLARDGLALIARLGLEDYDLGGYSLGGRTAVRMVVEGARPRRLVVAGMGLEGLLDTGARGRFFRRVLAGVGSHARGSEEWRAEAFLKTTGGDPEALLPLLDSFVDTTRAELEAIAVPTLVLAGEEDEENGSQRALAEALPDARFVAIPGTHMSAVTRPALGEAIARFLAA